MSNQQPYGYPPPPPPPSQSNAPQNGYSPYNPQMNYNQPPQPNGRGRGGRGRGGGNYNHGGRGDFHSQPPYNPQPGGYNASGAPGGYGVPPAVNGGGYGPQNPPSYGNQPSSSYPSAPPPPQWQHEQQQQHQQPPPQTQVSPPPIPLSAQNYHPNYAPQVYQGQPTVYGPPPPQHNSQPQIHQQQQQPPPHYMNSPQPPNSFTQNTHSPQTPLPGGPPPQQQWGGPSHPPHTPQPHFNGGRGGRGRGGNSQGRGGFDAPLMGPPIRMGFDNDHSSQASNNGFSPFTTPQHGSPPVNVSSPLYQNNQNGYRSQSQRGRGGHRGGNRSSLDPNPFYTNNNRGGPGGFSNQRGNFNNNNRGNRGDSNGFKPRYNRDFKGYTDNRGQPASDSAADLPEKPGTMITGGEGKKKKKQKKRKTNTLGLTPGAGDDSGTEDDADEENRLASIAGGLALVPSDLNEWLADRKRKWPTAAIREAKAAELAKRREQAREQSIRDKAKAQKDREERLAIEAKLAQIQNADSKKSKKHDGETKLERQQRKADKLRKQLEKAEKKVQNSLQAGSKRKRETGDDGDDDVLIKQEYQSGDQAKAKAEEDDSSDSSSDSDSDSDDESGPEAQSSHPDTRGGDWNYKPHPLIHTKPCKYFSSGGTCGKMNRCRFIHDQAARDASLKERAREGGRVSLKELLIQNEQDKENLTVLKAIQYLAENGLLDESPSTSATGQTSQEVKGVGQDQVMVEASDNDSGADNYHEAIEVAAST